MRVWSVRCTGGRCRALIAFLATVKGKRIPINIESLSDADKTQLEEGRAPLFDRARHVPHHSTCVDVSQFRKPRT